LPTPQVLIAGGFYNGKFFSGTEVFGSATSK
jgi:hypothetical protein